MFRFRQQPRSPIGLDIGARRVKAVQLEPAPASASGWRLAAAASVARTIPDAPLSPAEASRLFDTLDRLGFIGRRVVLAAPSDKLISGALELPRAGQIPLEQIARVELARTSKTSPDSFEMGCWELPAPARAGKAVHVMAVGYPHAEATQLLDLVEGAGFDVVGLDVRSCALARACAGVASPPPGITALIDLGWASASLVLAYNGSVVSVRPLTDAGFGRVHEALSKRLRLDPEVADYLLTEVGLRETSADGPSAASTPASAGEPGVQRPDDTLTLPSDARNLVTAYVDAVVRELLASFSYAARQYTDASVTRLLLSGAGAAVPGLPGHLEKELTLDTKAVAPGELAECPTALLVACSSPELTPAVGLAQFPET